jgi:hypothetical protein
MTTTPHHKRRSLATPGDQADRNRRNARNCHARGIVVVWLLMDRTTSLDSAAEASAASRSRLKRNKSASLVAVQDLQASVVHAVRRAERSYCPNARLHYVYSLGSASAYELPCGSWACSWCSRLKQGAAHLVIAAGIDEALARGDRVRLATFTDGSGGEMTVATLYEAWNRLRTKLRRKGVLEEFAAVLETTAAGALHLHCLMTGRYIAQQRLSRLAEEAGFGRVCDIREVKPGTEEEREENQDAAWYVAKQMAGYVTKTKSESLASKTAVRRRPLRRSRGWCSHSMHDAELAIRRQWAEEAGEVHGRDGGPWIFVHQLQDGSLRMRLPDKSILMAGGVRQDGAQTSGQPMGAVASDCPRGQDAPPPAPEARPKDKPGNPTSEGGQATGRER